MSATPPADNDSLANQVRKELDDMKSMAAAFGPQRLRDGSWFTEFIRAMLLNYSEEIIAKGGVEFFRKRYPGLTQDAIVEKLADLAVKYAAIAGGLSGFTSSAAVVATIGTAGGAGVITVPAAVVAVGTEILYTTKLQIRLVYDIAMVYGYPILLDDPEQLYRAFSLAYGITAATGGVGQVAKTIAPEVTRAQMRGLLQGNTAAIQAAAIRVLGPRIGQKITQKGILKAAVPAVGVAVSSGWNYVATKQIAAVAKGELRLSANARNAVKQLLARYHIHAEHAPTLVQVVLAIITADGRLDAREQEVHKFVVQELQLSAEAVAEIEGQVALDPDVVVQQLQRIEAPDLRKCLSELGQLAAAVSGDIAPAEAELVTRFATALHETVELASLTAQAAQYKRGETRLDQTTRALQQTAAKAGQGLASAGKSLVGMFKRKPASVDGAASEARDAEPQPVVLDPQEALRRLTVLYSSGLISDEDFELQRKQWRETMAKPPVAAPSAAVPVDVVPSAPPAESPALAGARAMEMARLQCLIALAKVDGSVDDSEREFVEVFIQQADLTDIERDTLRTLLNSKERTAPDLTVYQDQFDAAIGLIMDLIALANINEKLHPAEKIYIRKTAEQLGLPKDDVDELLAAG